LFLLLFHFSCTRKDTASWCLVFRAKFPHNQTSDSTNKKLYNIIIIFLISSFSSVQLLLFFSSLRPTLLASWYSGCCFHLNFNASDVIRLDYIFPPRCWLLHMKIWNKKIWNDIFRAQHILLALCLVYYYWKTTDRKTKPNV
jgi:hypothetical protein